MSTVIVDKSLDAEGPWFLTIWKQAPGQQIAICDRCHTMLGHPIAVKNRAGRVLTVGCDCAEALFMADHDVCRGKLELRRLSTVQKAHEKSLRDARDARKKDELNTLMEDPATLEILKSKPHPMAHRAERGETLLDWAQFMIKASGAAGRAKTLKAIKAAVQS